MNARNFRFVVVFAVTVALWGSTCLLVDMGVAQEPPAPKVDAGAVAAPSGAASKTVQIYTLKYTDGQLLTQIVPVVFPEASVALDSSANRVVIMASPAEHGRVAQLIEELDVAAPDDAIKVFSLLKVAANTMVDVLSTIADNSRVRLSVDTRSNSLLAAGPANELAVIEALVSKLDQERVDSSRTFHIRVVWFAEGSAASEALAANEQLSAVTRELSKIGMEGLRPTGQTLVSTAVDGKFELECSAVVGGGPADVRIQGQLSVQQRDLRLVIDVDAVRRQADEGAPGGTGAGGGPRQLVTLSTEIVAPPGHYVVLGVTPVHEKTLAVAVQVQPAD